MKKFLPIAFAAAIVMAGCKPAQPADVTNNDQHDARVTSTQEMLVGKWSSEDDRNFEREYKDDGTVVDSTGSVDGDVNTEASWSLFTAANAGTDVPFQMNNDDVYIKQTEEGGSVTYFRVTSVSPTELELVNMTKGGGMRFGKMNGNEMRDGEEQ
jgi:hypothetical protein